MGLENDIDVIARQEHALRFDRLDEDTAWRLGSLLREQASAAGWPVVVDVRTFHRPLFFAALPGSTPDNVDWARRKRNVVERFGRSSYAIGLELQLQGTTLQERYGLGARDHATHGGAFPLALPGTGVIGCVAVSGLPQREDHMAIVRALCTVLGHDGSDLELE